MPPRRRRWRSSSTKSDSRRSTRARPNRTKERVLAMEDAVRDHSDVVSIEERDRTYRASSRFDLPTSKGGSDQVSQGLRAAPVPSVPHESVERFQEWTFERDTDPGNGHSRPRSGKTPRPQEEHGPFGA